jgi:hypothetical protein
VTLDSIVHIIIYSDRDIKLLTTVIAKQSANR